MHGGALAMRAGAAALMAGAAGLGLQTDLTKDMDATGALQLVSSATGELAGPYKGEVLEAVDGDTLAVRVRIWLGQDVTIKVRLVGLDTPELHARCAAERTAAEAARTALASLTSRGPVTLTNIRNDKFGGRVLADVHNAAGQDLASHLIQTGFGRAYKGKTRQSWCD